MKQVMMGILFGLMGASLACAQKGDDMKKSMPSTPKVIRKYLLTHGFKQSTTDSDIYNREHVRLADVARDLGFSVKDLQPTLNQYSHSDVRTVKVSDLTFVVKSEVRDKNGNIVGGSLDNPDAICTISVSLLQVPVREYAKTDSSPRMCIKSVVVPEDRSKPLQITFELASTGKKPVAMLQSDFQIRLTGGNIPPYTRFGNSFPEGTPQIIAIAPGKPVVFKLCVPVDEMGSLSAGKYVVRIRIGNLKWREPQRFDYEWEGREHLSNEYKFVIK